MKITILIKISLKLVPKGLIYNKPALVWVINQCPAGIGRQQVIIWSNADLVGWCIYVSPGPNVLTHWSQDKMDAILQTTLSSAFSWMKMFEFRLQFDWCS